MANDESIKRGWPTGLRYSASRRGAAEEIRGGLPGFRPIRHREYLRRPVRAKGDGPENPREDCSRHSLHERPRRGIRAPRQGGPQRRPKKGRYSGTPDGLRPFFRRPERDRCDQGITARVRGSGNLKNLPQHVQQTENLFIFQGCYLEGLSRSFGKGSWRESLSESHDRGDIFRLRRHRLQPNPAS